MPSATVTIRDGSLSPVVVRIDVPGKVTWSNQGARPHVVVSLSASFQPLVLRPGQSKSVTFRSRRCELYSVDGRLNGRVLAGVSACAGGGVPRGGPGGETPGVGEKILRYDVRVTAYLHQVETHSPAGNPAGTGTTDLELSWTGTWRKMEVKLHSAGGSASFATTQETTGRGTVRGQLTWSESRQAYGPCSGKIHYAAKGVALLQGSKAQGSKPSVAFDAGVDDTNAITTLTQTKQAAACDGPGPGLPPWEGPGFVVLGVNVHRPPGASIHPMDTRWSREGGSGAPFPLDRILAHRGFTIDSGTRRASRSDTGYQLKFTGRVRYVFTPVR